MQFPVAIEIRRSVILIVLLSVVYAGAMACVITQPLPFFLRVLLMLLLCASGCRVVRRHQISRVRLASRDKLECQMAGRDGYLSAEALADSAVYAHLIVLRLSVSEASDSAYNVNTVLLADQMPSDQFRALRLWLRWQVGAKKSAPFVS